MAYLMVRETIQDYGRWKPVFDSEEETRRASGSRSAQVFRDDSNPNEITVLMEWDSLENARRFATSPQLRETMERGGVIGHPEASFLNEADRRAH